ncbi:MAG: hypothetical protein BWK80_30565 [Desulfobacteraceae bacterium IS3]|nr:MAG: hypothetical protein BWK80_30565 [Desulfobacteraceae bacterium IS3]
MKNRNKVPKILQCLCATLIAAMMFFPFGCSSSDDDPVSTTTTTATAVTSTSTTVTTTTTTTTTTLPVLSLKTTRDDKGVWFISGPENASLYDVFEAMGYAVATDRLWQAETYRRSARGRLSEILGAGTDNANLKTDMFMRTIGYSGEELQAAFDSLDSKSKSVVNGYVAGFNRRIAEIRKDISLLPFEFAALKFSPEDWTCSDLLAWTALMLRNFDSEGYEAQGQIDNAVLFAELATKFPNDFQAMFEDLRWVSDPDALTYIPKSENASRKADTESPIISKISAKTASMLPDLTSAAADMAETRSQVRENLKKINAYPQMGSYAWVLAGSKTASGNPILYSGPQMGFPVPSVVLEGSIRAGGLNISGMTVAGIPGIIIGRTPHHAWSMQVGHAHTVDYYLESPSAVSLHRMETIKVAGQDDVQLPVFRSSHGPVINPLPYNPSTYTPSSDNPIISWKYSHWGYELDVCKALLQLAQASSMDEFGAGIESVGVSHHFCYADRDGNIAYWMSGRDPLRTAGEYRLPQGFLPGIASAEWDAAVLRPRSTDRNTSRGFYGGWNNKSSADYSSAFNKLSYYLGKFHRAHVVEDYLSAHSNLTFEKIRDLAVNIATTDSFNKGGNPWKFVADDFSGVIRENSTENSLAALALLENYDGHFVAGGESNWATGLERPDAWYLADKWIREVIRLTFEDELGTVEEDYAVTILFNVLLRGLAGDNSGIVNRYNWFQNISDENAPQTVAEIIVQALDNVFPLFKRPPTATGDYRERIDYKHNMLGSVHQTLFSWRSTYAHCVEFGKSGPLRIESMFPLGESGNILMGADGKPVFDAHFFSMTPVFDAFAPRNFPLFE